MGGGIFLAVLLALSASLPKKVSVTHNLKKEVLLREFSGARIMGQTFTAELNNLSCIEVMLSSSNKRDGGNFFFYLKKERESKTDIFKFQGEVLNIRNNEFFRFEFPEIKHSKEKKYVFLIEIPESLPVNALDLWSSSEDQYERGEKIINGEIYPGDLVFKTEYQQGFMLSGELLIQRLCKIGSFFANLIKNKIFYLLLFFLFFIWGSVTFIQKKRILQKKYGFWAVFGFILLAVLAGVMILFSGKIVVYNQFKNTIPEKEIYGKENIGQTFTADYDYLWAVDVLMATHRRKVTGEIVFHLKRGVETPDGLVQKKVSTEKIKDNRFYRYQFPKIRNSKGKEYYFYLEAPEAEPGNAVALWTHHEDKYFDGEKIINGRKAQGDLVFRTVYKAGWVHKAGLFLKKITKAKPFPLNKSWFYIGLIGIFLLSSAFFLTFIMKIIDES
jgi:hypothetical protein